MSYRDYLYGTSIENEFRPVLLNYYKKYFSDYKPVNIAKYQKIGDIDAIAKLDNEWYMVEEKFAHEGEKQYTALMVEHIQNSNIGSPGWYDITKAEILLYCFCSRQCRTVRVNHIDYKKFKIWYEMAYRNDDIKLLGKSDTKPYGRLVNINTIPPKILIRQETLHY